jgi:hypothetical protein
MKINILLTILVLSALTADFIFGRVIFDYNQTQSLKAISQPVFSEPFILPTGRPMGSYTIPPAKNPVPPKVQNTNQTILTNPCTIYKLQNQTVCE